MFLLNEKFIFRLKIEFSSGEKDFFLGKRKIFRGLSEFSSLANRGFAPSQGIAYLCPLVKTCCQMDKDNQLYRVLALMSLTLLICFGMYCLPDTLFGYKIKKVDLLSDFKVKSEKLSLDSLRSRLERADTLQVDSVALRDSIRRTTGIDSAALALRDSLYEAIYAVKGADSLGTHIEDYSLGHIGLKRFFTALRNRKELGRPVRVAFLGDSFIEGDIMVADVRSGLQKEFGGRGVGFVPVTSVAAQFRPTVEGTAEGWTTWSVLTDKEHGYTLPGMMFEATEENASIHLKATDRYPELRSASSLKLIYERNANTEVTLASDAFADTLRETLPMTLSIKQREWRGTFNEVDFSFANARDFRVLGVVMEDTAGITVDNFSLRGNSGMILDRLDTVRCRDLSEIRPYDLIVLQYGLNVVSDSVMEYGWYASRMVKAVNHLRSCFPDTDILMLGVSDRGRQEEGQFETMPAVLALLYAQRSVARKAGIPFEEVFDADETHPYTRVRVGEEFEDVEHSYCDPNDLLSAHLGPSVIIEMW